jgi:hypothetical protein
LSGWAAKAYRLLASKFPQIMGLWAGLGGSAKAYLMEKFAWIGKGIASWRAHIVPQIVEGGAEGTAATATTAGTESFAGDRIRSGFAATNRNTVRARAQEMGSYSEQGLGNSGGVTPRNTFGAPGDQSYAPGINATPDGSGGVRVSYVIPGSAFMAGPAAASEDASSAFSYSSPVMAGVGV